MLKNRLPQLLEKKAISIRELARRTGITYTTIRAVVKGERRSIQLDVLEKICLALEIQPGDIYFASDRVRRPPGSVMGVPESLPSNSAAGHAEAKKPGMATDAGPAHRRRGSGPDWRTW